MTKARGQWGGGGGRGSGVEAYSNVPLVLRHALASAKDTSFFGEALFRECLLGFGIPNHQWHFEISQGLV